jgi:hypothetical protein
METGSGSRRRVPLPVSILIFTIRSVLLWVLVPVFTMYWIILLPFPVTRGVGLSQFLGWADWNLVSVLERLFGHLIAEPLRRIPISKASTVQNRIGMADFS